MSRSFHALTFLFFVRFAAVQKIAEKAKLLRKEAKGVQHMAMKDEVRLFIFTLNASEMPV